MSLTSYRAAPPRVTIYGQCRVYLVSILGLPVLRVDGAARICRFARPRSDACADRTGGCSTPRHLCGRCCGEWVFELFCCCEVWMLRFADLAATYSPAS